MAIYASMALNASDLLLVKLESALLQAKEKTTLVNRPGSAILLSSALQENVLPKLKRKILVQNLKTALGDSAAFSSRTNQRNLAESI